MIPIIHYLEADMSETLIEVARCWSILMGPWIHSSRSNAKWIRRFCAGHGLDGPESAQVVAAGQIDWQVKGEKAVSLAVETFFSSSEGIQSPLLVEGNDCAHVSTWRLEASIPLLLRRRTKQNVSKKEEKKNKISWKRAQKPFRAGYIEQNCKEINGALWKDNGCV